MLTATLLFAVMGLCVKWASSHFSAGEIVMVRGVVGVLFIALVSRWRGVSLATRVPQMHFWRGLIGVVSLCLWFWAIGGLPLATAMTLNYMSAIWMALFLMGGALLLGGQSVDARLLSTVLVGFVGVALVLQPTFERNQLPWALAGLASGLMAAMAYMQVTALGRAGEPELRVVFYFSLASVAAGAAVGLATPSSGHLASPGWPGALLLLAVGFTATIAQLCMTAAYARGKMLVNASLNYMGIAFSALFGWLAFDEQPGWLAAGGIVLIVVAGIVATLLRSRQNKDLPGETHE